MQMGELRGKTPEMVRKEVWAHVLAYNLIRTVMAQAAARHDVVPRSISFTGAMQTAGGLPAAARRSGRPAAPRTGCACTTTCSTPSPPTGSRTAPTGYEPRLKKRRTESLRLADPAPGRDETPDGERRYREVSAIRRCDRRARLAADSACTIEVMFETIAGISASDPEWRGTLGRHFAARPRRSVARRTLTPKRARRLEHLRYFITLGAAIEWPEHFGLFKVSSGADMSSSLATRASLLLRIRDPQDRMAWEEFVSLYAPLVHAYGRRRGLQDHDAADLTQEVLLSRRPVGRRVRLRPGPRVVPRLAPDQSPERTAEAGEPSRARSAGPATATSIGSWNSYRTTATRNSGTRTTSGTCSSGPRTRSAANSGTRRGRPSGRPRCWPKTSIGWPRSYDSRRVPSTWPAVG